MFTLLQTETVEHAESLIVPDSVQKARLAEVVEKISTTDYNELLTELATQGCWILLKIALAFIIYLVAGSAEINRGPFDMAEAESELTAGYHTEYSGIHFGFYYLAEYLNLFIMGGIATTLFLGGWMPLHIPGWESFNTIMDYIPSIVWFLGKSIVVVWISMWFRWTFPRLRIDQLLKLEWKYLLPISLVNLAIMSVIVALGWHF